MTQFNHSFGQPTATSRSGRRLRLRIIPGTFLLIFTSVAVIGIYFNLWEIISINTKNDWTRIAPRHPAAITAPHVAVWLFSVMATQAAGVATYAWFYGKWSVAWVGTAIFFYSITPRRSSNRFK